MQNLSDKDLISQDKFDKDPRRRQELMGRPIADAIYQSVFGKNINITRYEHGDNFILDTKFAVDVELEFPSGLILTGQEKFLSLKYADYNSITVEYMNNEFELGNWFNLAAQFYMVGYFTQDYEGFNPWIISNWAAIVWQTLLGNIEWHDNENKDGHAQASFKYCDMRALPQDCIIASSFLRSSEW